jgi:uncharacterized membrane protein HdeD (DUF308 family)
MHATGIQGALSMVLALDVPESMPGRQRVLTLTCGVVVLSILVQGLTMTGATHPVRRLPDVLVMNLSPTVTKPVESIAHHAGWATALRGIIAVAFGVIALRSPHIAAATLVVIFAIFAFADGALDFVLAARLGRAGQRWGWYLFEGIVSIALGVIALAYPGVTLLALVLLVALRAIMLGVLELVAAFSWETLDSRWLLGLTGALSIVLGILLLGAPVAGAMTLIYAIGFYAIVAGVALFALGLRLISADRHERHERQVMQGPAATAS